MFSHLVRYDIEEVYNSGKFVMTRTLGKVVENLSIPIIIAMKL